jgi:hypothetical protein
MLKRVLTIVRRLFRLVAAITIWLDVLHVFRPNLPFADAATFLGIDTPALGLMVFIAALSVASAYGFRNYALDAIYIWAFPFVLAWKLAVAVFIFLKWAHRAISLAIPTPDAPLKFSETLPILESISKHQIAKVQVSASSAQLEGAPAPQQKESAQESSPKRLTEYMSLLPFWRFTLVWGLLIAVSSNSNIIIAGLVFASVGIVRSVARVWRAAFQFKTMNDSVLLKANEWLSTFIQSARPLNTEVKPSAPNPTANLLLLKFVVIVITKTKEAYQVLILIGVIIAVTLYSWLSLAFYFIYLGIAKLSLPKERWPTLFDSVFLPLMGGNIAQTWPLRITVVTHYLAIAFLGYVIWRFLGAEMRRCQRVLSNLEERVESELSSLEQPPTIEVISAPQSGTSSASSG